MVDRGEARVGCAGLSEAYCGDEGQDSGESRGKKLVHVDGDIGVIDMSNIFPVSPPQHDRHRLSG